MLVFISYDSIRCFMINISTYTVLVVATRHPEIPLESLTVAETLGTPLADRDRLACVYQPAASSKQAFVLPTPHAPLATAGVHCR